MPAELEQLVALHGIKDRSWGGFSLLPNFSLGAVNEGGETSYAALWYTKADHTVNYRTNQDTDQSFTFSWVLIVEYTKTTDQATVELPTVLSVNASIPSSVSAPASSAKRIEEA